VGGAQEAEKRLRDLPLSIDDPRTIAKSMLLDRIIDMEMSPAMGRRRYSWRRR
jgi:hypothetical protein